MVLSEWLKTWLTDKYKQKSDKTIKRNTYISYEGYIRNYLSIFDYEEVNEVTTEELQRFSDKLLEDGLSAKTIHNMFVFLREGLKYGVLKGNIKTNVALSVNLPQYERPEIKILSYNQEYRLIKESYSHRYGVFVRFVLRTGIRLGELLGLKWDDIDFERHEMKIRRILHRCKNFDPKKKNKTSIFFDPPKTKKSRRTIPLTYHAEKDLLDWKQLQNLETPHAEFVVTNKTGKYLDPTTFRKYYKEMLDRCDIHGITFHSLRHTFATNALERGMDKKVLSEILGHYSVAFTLDTYAHVVDPFKRSNMDLMDNIYYNQEHSSILLLFKPFHEQFIVSIPNNRDYTFIADSLEDGIHHINRHKAEIVLKKDIDIKKALYEKGKEEIAVFVN